MAFTGTYKNGTLTVRATAAGTPSSVHFGTAAESGDAVINVTNKTYTGDAIPTADEVTVLDASGVAAKNAINFTTIEGVLTKLETLKGTKGGDVIDVKRDLTIQSNAGADTLIATGGTVSDYDGKVDVVKFGTTADGFTVSMVNATYSGKNLTLSYNGQSIELTNARDKMINIADKDGNIISSQYFPTDPDYYEITNSNTGTIVSSDAEIIDGSGRKAAIVINATGATEGQNQSIVSGAGNDTIYALGTNQIINVAKGNDYVVVNANSGNVTIEDFGVGDSAAKNPTGDKIVLDGVTIDETQTVYDNESGNVTFTYKKDNEEKGKIIVEGGLWNQIKPANAKAQIAFYDNTNGTFALNTSYTKAYSDPETVVISGAVAKDMTKNGINLTAEDTLTAISGNGLAIGAATVTGDATTLDFSNVSANVAITVDATAAGNNITNIYGGKGKETLTGTGKAPGAATAITITAVNKIYTEVYSYSSQDSDVSITVTNNEIISVSGNDASAWLTEHDLQIGDGLTDTQASRFGVTQTSKTEVTGHYNITLSDNTEIKDVVNATDLSTVAPTGYTLNGTFSATDTANGYGLTSGSKAADGDTYLVLDGGKGNDVLSGYNVTLTGGEGNDTFKAANGGNASMVGGAGNDVFYLTGAGAEEDTTNYISDFYAGTDKTTKAAKGTDKITVAYDKYNVKNVVGVAHRAEIVGGEVDGNDLTLTVAGNSWATVTAEESVSKTKSVGNFETYGVSTFKLEGVKGETISVTNEGITYSQIAASGGAATVTGNWLGYLDPNATSVSGEANNKAQRIDLTGASDVTAATAGGRNDTLIGNGKAALTGGKGNDFFFVKGGDTVVDYSASGTNGKDKIYVNSLDALSNVSNSSGTLTITQGDVETLEVDGATYTAAEGANSAKVEVTIDGTSYTITLNNDGSAIQAVSGGTATNSGMTFTVDGTTYTVSIDADNNSAKVTYDDMSGASQFTMTSAAGQAISFNELTYQYSTNAKNGLITEKAVTNTMVRTFGTGASDSIVTFKAADGNYLKVFEGETDVKIINAKAGKALTIDNNATGVNSIVGSAKADVIYTGSNSEGDAISVSAGNGNDVIILEGETFIGSKDFTAAKINNKGKITAGDVIVVDAESIDMTGSGTTVGAITWSGSDVIINLGEDKFATLEGAKDKNAIILTKSKYDSWNDGAGFTVNDTVASTDKATVSLANPDEYLLAKTETYALGSIGSKHIINAAASTKNQPVFDLTTSGATDVTAIYTGAKADTVVASANVALIDTGAGNDVVSLQAATSFVTEGEEDDDTVTSPKLEVVSGAGNDIFVVDGDTKAAITDYTAGTDKVIFAPGENGYNINITNVSVARDGDATVLAGKGKNAGVAHYYKYTYTLDGDGQLVIGGQAIADSLASANESEAVEKLKTTAGINAKLTVIADTVASAKATSFALDYMSANAVIENADGSFFDLTGANASTVQFSSARTKAATITGADAGMTVTALTGKNAAVTFIGSTYSSAATYVGSKKNDVYIGNGALDNVNLGDGVDTINRGGRATITLGSGNDIALIQNGDGYTVTDYTAGQDKFILDSAMTLTSATIVKKGSINILTLNFVGGDSDNQTYASVSITNYKIGDKVTIQQFGTNNKGKQVINSYFQGGFGTDLVVVDADSTANGTISGALAVGATKIDASGTKKAHVLDQGGNNSITEITGGAGNDTIVANANSVSGTTMNLAGGAGNDTFILTVGSKGNIAHYNITDFNTGKDVIKFVDSTGKEVAATLTDYSETYTMDTSAGSIVLNVPTYTTVTLTNKAKATNLISASGVSTAIRLNSDATGVTVSNTVDINLTKAAKATTFAFSETKTFNATASQNAVTVSNAQNLTSFKGSAKGDTLTLDNAGNDIAATLGAGNDNVDLTSYSKKVTATYTGGNDTFDDVTSDNLSITLGNIKIKSIASTDSGYTGDAVGTSTKTLDKVEITTNKSDGKITLDGAEGTTFTITQKVEYTKTKDATYKKDSDGNATEEIDSAEQGTYKVTRSINFNGLQADFFTETKTKQTSNPYANTVTAAYEERGFEELVSDNNFATASDLDNITDVKADDAAIAVDYSSPLTSIDSASDFTQVTTAAAKKKQN